MRIRIAPRVAFWTLAALTLLVSHDLVWLVQTGPGANIAAELRRAAHGYWAIVSAAILLIGAVVIAATAWRLAALRRRARHVGSGPAELRPRWDGRKMAIAWLRLAGIVMFAFAVQENVEHFVAHGHVLGGGALLGPEYPLAIPVIAALTAIAAMVTVGLNGAENRLEQHIADALRAIRDRPPIRLHRPSKHVVIRRLAALVGTDAGRAPPPLLVRA